MEERADVKDRNSWSERSSEEEEQESKLKSQMLIFWESFFWPHLGDNMSLGQTDVSLWALFFNHVRTHWQLLIQASAHLWNDLNQLCCKDPGARAHLYLFIIPLIYKPFLRAFLLFKSFCHHVIWLQWQSQRISRGYAEVLSKLTRED